MKEFLDFTHHLQLTIKALQLYAPEHPRSHEALQQLKIAADSMLKNRDRLQVIASHGRIFADRKLLDERNPHIVTLVKQLSDRKINGFVFLRDVSIRELEGMAKLLTMKPGRIDELGGSTQVLENFDVSRVRVSHVRYEELTDAEEVVEASYLAELNSAARNSTETIRRDELPTIIAGIFKPILDLVQLREASQGKGVGRGPGLGSGGLGTGSPTTSGDELTIDVTGADLDPATLEPFDMKPLEMQLTKSGALGSPDFEALFADTILSFDAETQARLLVSRESMESGPLREMLDTLAPTVVLNIVASLAEKKFSADGEFPEIVKFLYSKIDPPDRSLERLRARLDGMGLDRDQVQELVEVLTWEQLDFDTKIKRLHEGRRIFEIPHDRLLRFLRDLLVQEKHDAFLALIERYGTGLTAESADLRRTVSDGFHRISMWGKDPGFLPAEEVIIQRLLMTHFLREPDHRLQQRCSDALSAFLGVWMAAGKADKATKTLQNLEAAVAAVGAQLPWKKPAYDSLIMQLAREHVGSVVQLLYTNDQESNNSEAYPILTFLGSPAASELIDRLAAEDDRQKRGRLIKAVKTIGKPALLPLRHAMSSSTWYLVRNALNLLGDLAAIELVDEVGQALEHSDGRVRRAAVRALSKMTGERPVQLLVSQLGKSGDAEMLTEVLFCLGGMKAETAVGPITELTRPRRLGAGDDTVRERAVDALGQIGSAKAIPTLEELIKRKGMLGGESADMRLAAARALAQIATPEAKIVIKKAVETEGSGATRDQMVKFLETAV